MTVQVMNFLAECSLRVTAILAVAWAASFLLRTQTPALRHIVWTAAFAVAALTPLLYRFGPKAVQPSAISAPVETAAITVRAATPQKPPREVPFGLIGIAIWAAGAVIFITRMGRSAMFAARLRKSAIPLDQRDFEIPDHISAAVGESESAAVAMTLGIRSPLILLPVQHRFWAPARQRCVLLHELAHVRRKDCLLQWLPQIVCALHWFNPLAWLARSQMLCESERACDDAVLRGGGHGPDFARDLLEIAECSGLKGADPMLITVTTRLERRIARLLDSSANRNPLSFLRASAAFAIITTVLLPLAAIRAQDASSQTGTLSGVVSDPAGAFVANAIVNLTGPAGNLALAAGPTGAWTAKNLPPGAYQINVSVPGFAPLRQLADVGPGTSTQLAQRLMIGQMVERVSVIGARNAAAPTAVKPAPVKVRIGGNVQAAKLISRTPPVYPDSLREQGIEATVLIQAVIGKNGTVLDPHIVGNQTAPEFGQAALDAVRTWQFDPARLNGEPVEVITTVTVDFQLR